MRTFKNFLMGILPIVGLLFVVACQEGPENEPGNDKPVPPVVEKDATIILSKTTIDVSLAGGSYLLEYSIENAHAGEKISAEPEDTWVKDFNYGISGALGFTVEANPTDAPRECLVTIKYRYAEDVAFLVKQGARTAAGFKIEKVSADYFSYTINVIPEDKTLPYIVMSAGPEYIVASELVDGQDFYEDDFAYFGWVGQVQPVGMSAVEVMQSRAKIGDQYGITVSDGASGVPYTVYCYYFDYQTGALISDVVFATVETAKPELQNVEFEIEYEVEGPMVKASVVPVGFDGNYYFDMLNGLLVDSYMSELDFLDSVERTAEYYWSNAIYTMSDNASYDEIIADFTCKGTNPDGTPKSYYEFELLANHDYYLFAFTMEEHGLCSSAPKVVKITTGDVEPSDNVITPSVEYVTTYTAVISFKTTNNDHYVAGWTTADEWATYGSTDAERQAYLLKNNAYELIKGNYSQNVTHLEPNTEYVLYAFGSRGGVATTDKVYTCNFTTKSDAGGNVTIDFKDLGYYDATDFADCPGYEYFANYTGRVIYPIEVVFSSENHGDYFFDIYDWTGRKDIYNDKQYIDHLIYAIDTYGSLTATHTYMILNIGGCYELIAVVLDDEGQFSSLYRKVIEPTYNGCGDVDDYVAWWDAYQDSQNGGAELQSLVYDFEEEEKQLFAPKAKRNFYSEQEHKVENKCVGVDAIVASRVR